jgi:hypothetical protein
MDALKGEDDRAVHHIQKNKRGLMCLVANSARVARVQCGGKTALSLIACVRSFSLLQTRGSWVN